MRMKTLFCVLALAIAPAVQAQTYPAGPVKVVVPFAAGSSTDLIGREAARVLSEGLHQSFVVENRPGAQSTIGASEVARAKPDGYTLLIGSNTSIAAAPFLLKSVPYKPLTDLQAVARIGAVPFVLVARADLPVDTPQALIDYGHQHPGKLNWGYANAANQAAAAMMTYTSKMDTVAVPYTSVPQMVVDMLGHRLDFGIIDTTNAGPQVAAGKLRALAVTSGQPLQQFPGVPPLGDTLQGYELLGWYGVYAPAKTPPQIVDTLAKVLIKGMDSPETKARLAKAGLIPYPAGPEELARFGQLETDKWARMVKAAGIQPE
ncbi:Bug family tripartite tricarboxylate transporter substrate binding protein [Bordetella genomosp. 9]|nr:tripartite tricarboxylate transporter substrate binding protein [Bordetella genomosp. 9]